MNIQRSFSHTDLALELKDELEESLEEQQAFDGIKIQQERIGERGLQETVIEIDSEEGEKQLGKPRGIYVTLEGENMAGNDGSFHEEMSECLAKRLQSLLSGKRKLLFIGLGSPKQEKFILNNKSKLKSVKILMPVGGSFDVISNNLKRAPKWIIKINLEWLYRLIKQPKRIFRQVKLLKFIFLCINNKRKRRE